MPIPKKQCQEDKLHSASKRSKHLLLNCFPDLKNERTLNQTISTYNLRYHCHLHRHLAQIEFSICSALIFDGVQNCHYLHSIDLELCAHAYWWSLGNQGITFILPSSELLLPVSLSSLTSPLADSDVYFLWRRFVLFGTNLLFSENTDIFILSHQSLYKIR